MGTVFRDFLRSGKCTIKNISTVNYPKEKKD